jgi:DNA-binding transcriptional MocR family regulator
MPTSQALKLDARAAPTLAGQLVHALERAIGQGRYAPGVRLPAERVMAARLQLSRTTVTHAYRELESRGLVRSHVGRGTVVCARPAPGDAPFAWSGKLAAAAQRANDTFLLGFMKDAADPNLISMAAGSPALEVFPVDEFRRAADHILRRQSSAALGLAPTEGQPALRQAIAERERTRPERVLVVNGSQQGLDLLARSLLDPGDVAIMDRPGYLGAIQTFRAAGANVVGWDLRRAELDELEDLILRYRPKLLYTNPTFQNPTGRTFTIRERRDLLALAARYRLPVIEDDPYRETYLESPPPPSLYELDEHNVVIRLGTFSKTLAPGLRLGWVAAAEYISGQLALMKNRANAFSEGLGQLVIAEFLRHGLFDAHLERLRAEHLRRRSAMARALAARFPHHALEWTPPQGGLNFWCKLRGGVEVRPLLQQAQVRGMVFAKGEVFYPDPAGHDEFRVCFALHPPAKIEEGIRRLGEAWRAVKPRSAATLPLV